MDDDKNLAIVQLYRDEHFIDEGSRNTQCYPPIIHM